MTYGTGRMGEGGDIWHWESEGGVTYGTGRVRVG